MAWQDGLARTRASMGRGSGLQEVRVFCVMLLLAAGVLLYMDVQT